MTDRKCLGIDCAWCAEPECPNLKQKIIIDGVNVAECQHYLDKKGLHTKHDGRCLLFDCKCHEIDINTKDQCYYKQLQREKNEKKKHEEEWRLYNEAFKKSREEWEEQISKLIEKNNQISRDFFSGMYCNTKYCEVLQAKERECEELKAENKRLVGELANSVFDKFEELDRYKQALEKIKEIVTYCKNQDICTFCKYSEKCRDKEDYTLYDNNNLILTIINEVLNVS